MSIRDRIAIVALFLLSLGGAGAVALAAPPEGAVGHRGENSFTVGIGSDEGSSVRVYGCPSEDSCRMNFRVSDNGRPVWILRRVNP